ncbi:FMN-binding glutamate synthase family protein [Rhizobium alvei]|uniref:FMN-binding glutamate synthase family protein n=1 Tax=Rhizobium alvei TaxID=1132659 RepID=A0ABT8YHE5_9HYPH|nr:FMN-binding glutamate synthase family protein [Rhizobium alvei]MDO6963109.1 FMN-binding glutamate synthase family protein [Rhizobium alvei]
MQNIRVFLTARYLPMTISIILAVLLAILIVFDRALYGFLIVPFFIAAFLTAVGIHDLLQKRHSILRNYPIAGHARFIMEDLRPKIRQYFFEGEKDGRPFPRDKRSLAYQRAKGQLDKRPFGTEYDVYEPRYEWISHSLAPTRLESHDFRVRVGGPDCTKPYDASVLNISAMSFGSLSAAAIRALNRGAVMGGFYHDTGEGGLSPYHRENGGDIVWEIGSGYFGCRHPDGSFSPERFAETAAFDQIKMIEIKLSQGAKPGHGGVLPAAKISEEVSRIRGIPMGKDCVSPAAHPAFSTPLELMAFIAQLRRLSEGKPVGFKLCIGHAHEFLAIVKAMLETGITPDFIVVDGKEGGTGAAPSEYIDHIGMPLREGLAFVHNALVGAGLREKIRIGASGMIISAFDMARVMALGADWCNMARGFMFAIGCIQSQACHTDLCPVGVATQDPDRQKALVVPDKATRVAQFHAKTLEALAEVVAGCGLHHPSEFRPFHFHKRINHSQVTTFTHLYPPLRPGELLEGTDDVRFRIPWQIAQADTFKAA